MPKVSVIIPTYCHRNLVMETLSSVFTQSFQDIEVIVVNDGSPDDTADILRPLTESGRIRYFEQQNSGQAAARNRGIAEARGIYVALLDDDDLWPADKLEWQVNVLESRPEAAAVGGMLMFLRGETLSAHEDGRQPTKPSEWFGGNVFVSPGQTLIRREALEKTGPLDVSLQGSDDWDLWIRLCTVGPIIFDSRVALHYRLHQGNASRDITRMYLNSQKVVAKNLPLVPSAERAGAQKLSQKFIYEYVGHQLLRQAKEECSKGHFDTALRIVRLLAPSFQAAFADLRLSRRILADGMPEFIVNGVRRIIRLAPSKSPGEVGNSRP